MKFVKWTLNNRLYQKIVGDLVFRNSVEVGHISSISDVPLPPSQKFYLGGPNNMRGYSLFLLGPQTNSSQGYPQPLGGVAEGFALSEVEYPLIRDAGIKAVLFFDAGNTWDPFPNAGAPFTIRTDVGFGFRWFSPIGPLRFEWGFPLARKPNESESVFQFFIGPPF
jgi:outer membrane protein insertion porin family